ncbi:MAG: short-chain dehydrogenase/reductase [Rhodospirillales bacterium]|nr:short-chain dehydrogenase/reductase [Rhodospirillales bacterium]
MTKTSRQARRIGEADLAGIFAGKVVLVTGGGSGMGKSSAQRFAEEGGRVAVVDLNLEAAQAVVEAIRAAGGEALAVRADIASQADNDRMVAETIGQFGGLDAAFLNAAYLGPVLDFFETDAKTFDLIVGINLRGCFFGMQATARAMRPGGPVVVNASTAALAANQYSAVYTATKHGVLGLVRAAAEPFAERKLRINAICPGFIQTPMNGMADSVAPIAPELLEQPGFCGLGQPQHIAELALFLASARAAFVSGGAYLADGGLMANIPSVRF